MKLLCVPKTIWNSFSLKHSFHYWSSKVVLYFICLCHKCLSISMIAKIALSLSTISKLLVWSFYTILRALSCNMLIILFVCFEQNTHKLNWYLITDLNIKLFIWILSSLSSIVISVPWIVLLKLNFLWGFFVQIINDFWSLVYYHWLSKEFSIPHSFSIFCFQKYFFCVCFNFFKILI